MNIFIVGIGGKPEVALPECSSKKRDAVSGLYRRPRQTAAIVALGARGCLGDIATISEMDLAAAASDQRSSSLLQVPGSRTTIRRLMRRMGKG